MNHVAQPWVRKEVIGNATLYLGDCLSILPTLPKVDAVVTSPPYNQIDPSVMKACGKYKAAGDGWLANVAENGYADMRDEDEYATWLCSVVAACMERCDGTVWVNHKTRYRDGVAIHPVQLMPFPMWAEIIWARPGSMTLNAGRFAPSHERILGFGKPSFWDDSQKTHFTVWNMTPESYPGHPCAYPAELCKRLIAATCHKDGTVLDPFCGSGTTGAVAVQLERQFIGIEIEPKYFDIACERIENAQRQSRLFA
jgi:site-specific DNA-methyltransferase (adenine-specific)